MASNSWLFRAFPFLLLLLLAAIAAGMHFNGLYGQDAHAYLWQSKAMYAYLFGGAVLPHNSDNTDFSIGYPLAGAMMRFVIGDPVLALQVVSALSFALSAWILERIIAMLSHGSRADSRLVFTLLAFGLAPVVVRSGLIVMSDSLGLAFTLAAFFFGLRWIEQGHGKDSVFTAVCIGLAVSVRIGQAGLLLPLALVVGWHLALRHRFKWAVLAVIAGCVVLLPHVLTDNSVLAHPFQHSALHWLPAHFFQRRFQFENGLAEYSLPNFLYLAFPLMHPGFCLTLPGLLFFVKKTDIHLPAKKAILGCIGGYLLLLGGLPHQNLRFLLPVYALVLLLFFPAWDRLYCYGLHFFKRLTLLFLGLTLALQLVFCIRMMAPTWARNRLERTVAAEIRGLVPLGAVVYGFDLDIALRSYLPDVRFVNLWEKRYGDYPAGSFVLFNAPALRQQWDGQNPMLNWDFLQENYDLEVLKKLPEGWVLYAVPGRK